MYNYTDKEFLDSYFDETQFIWFLFEIKEISNKEREEQLEPYRRRLHELIKQGKVHNDKLRLVERA